MLNRLFLLVLIASCVLANPYPPRPRVRRPYISFKERLVGKNPIQSLINFLERKFPVKFYYPDDPEAPQPNHQRPLYGQPLQSFFVNGPLAPQQHVQYQPSPVQIQPVQSVQYQPSPVQIQPVQSVQYAQPQVQNLLVSQPQQVQYRAPVVSPIAETPVVQTPTQYEYIQQQQPLPYSQGQIPYQNLQTYPVTTISNPLLLSQMTALIPSLQEQVTAENMIKVLVIRPEDMNRLKQASNSERENMLRGSTTKYIDIQRGIQQLILGGATVENLNEIETGGESERECIQPLCDAFLGKVIPEILSSDKKNQNEEPVLILKESRPQQPLRNLEEPGNSLEESQVQDSDAAGSMPSAEPHFTVVRAIEDDESALEILHATD